MAKAKKEEIQAEAIFNREEAFRTILVGALGNPTFTRQGAVDKARQATELIVEATQIPIERKSLLARLISGSISNPGKDFRECLTDAFRVLETEFPA
jgi:hypothetical protein